MSLAGFAWECRCRAIAYSEEEPEECGSCNSCSSFIKLPEELVEEREANLTEEMLGDDSDSNDIAHISTRARASFPSKSKNARSERRKK